MKILALPSPHHWQTRYGADVEGWAYDEQTGQICPVVFDSVAGDLVIMETAIKERDPSEGRGKHKPYDKYMPDDPRRVLPEEKEPLIDQG